MNHEPHSLALLRKANPVSVAPGTVRTSQARAALERILQEPRVAHGPQEPIHARHAPGLRGLRARFAAGGAAISAVAAAVIVAVLSGSAAAPAFAGWTAKPKVALPQRITQATQRCGLTDPVLAEARGPYTAAVFVSRSGGSACVEGPSVSMVASIGGVQASDNPIRPDQIGMAVATWSDMHGHALILLAGRVGSGVRSIVIHRRDHIDVIASIRDGWYLAWWPARVHATGATVTTTGGLRDFALPALAKMTPTCAMPRHPVTGPPPPRSGTCVSSQDESNGPGSAGVPGPPMIGDPLARPFHRTLLINVYNASRVLACFRPPANLTAALKPNGPTGPCTPTTLLTRLPPRYPVQKNLLELFPKGVWKIKLHAATSVHGQLVFLVIAFGASGYGPTRNEMTVNW